MVKKPSDPGAPPRNPQKKAGKQATSAGDGQRHLHVRVKTAKKRTVSSQRWLARQLNDPYVVKSKLEGYRSRAAYKLIEIDDKYRFLKPGQSIVDLGAAPGGWSQVAAERIDAANGKGRVVAIDYLAFDPIPGVEILELDFTDPTAPARLKAGLGHGPADIVLSDMAAPTTGHTRTDHLRIIGLAEMAIEFAAEVLAPGGAFLCKVFQGGTEGEILALLKRNFATVRHLKPPASRKGSAELYVLATGFRGRTPALAGAGDDD